MTDADYHEEGYKAKEEQHAPASMPAAKSDGFVKGQLHKHLFKSSQKQGDLWLLAFAHFLFWVFMWSATMAILFYGIDKGLHIGFSWFIVLITGLVLAMMWLTRCKKCKGRCD